MWLHRCRESRIKVTMCPLEGHSRSCTQVGFFGFPFGIARIVFTGWFANQICPLFLIVFSAEAHREVVGSNVAAGQKVEGPVLAAVGRLKLVPQAELPLVLQLEADDGLTQGAPILADHTESGACGHDQGLYSQNRRSYEAQLVAIKGCQLIYD